MPTPNIPPIVSTDHLHIPKEISISPVEEDDEFLEACEVEEGHEESPLATTLATTLATKSCLSSLQKKTASVMARHKGQSRKRKSSTPNDFYMRQSNKRQSLASQRYRPSYSASFYGDFRRKNGFDDFFNGLSGQGSFLSYALTILDAFRALLSDQGDAEFTKMRRAQTSCRDAQEKANAVDSIIAEMSKEGPSAARLLPDAIYQFMKDNGITIDGVPVDTYTVNNTKKLNKGQMTAIKQALSNAADRSTDLVSQDNLIIQKITQTFNTLMGISNSIQTMLADMNNKIAQNIH